MNRLKALRNAKGMTQKEISEILNVSQGNYSRYENGTMMPTADTLIAMSKFYGVSVDYILGLESSSNDLKKNLDLITDYIEKIKKDL